MCELERSGYGCRNVTKTTNQSWKVLKHDRFVRFNLPGLTDCLHLSPFGMVAREQGQ